MSVITAVTTNPARVDYAVITIRQFFLHANINVITNPARAERASTTSPTYAECVLEKVLNSNLQLQLWSK